MLVSEFDYNLPKELIAQYPQDKRDDSRLLVVNKNSNIIDHKKFYDIINYLQKGDLLILNDSKVFPARLFGKKDETDGKIEVLLSRMLDNGNWEVKGKGLKIGKTITFNGGVLKCKVIDKNEDTYEISFNIFGENFFNQVEKIGVTPLPPYIKRNIDNKTSKIKNGEEKFIDKERYQTVYAKERGSIAAPTAGLHFTKELLNILEKKGVAVNYLTLHVGLGTFSPVKTELINDHKMHEELFSLDQELISKIKFTKKNGGRIIAVGTTTTRVLESIYNQKLSQKFNIETKNDGKSISGKTDIFIYPPYKFECVDAMITNFHLPKSTLMMLVSAFSSPKIVKNAYQIAVDNKYRFFSYGDAMLII